MSLFSYFNNKIKKKKVVKNAELRIKDAIYVPAHAPLFQYYYLGEFRNVMIPAICEITVEYENEEYILKDEKNLWFYLKFLKDIEFPNDELIIIHDIIIKEYKNGKKEIDLYKED